jgi:methionyl-tRNA formyltransferase
VQIRKVAFVGSKALGCSVLKAMHNIAPEVLVGAITLDDREDVRCALDCFQDFGARTGKPMVVLSKGSQLQAAIGQLQPEMCIVVGWYWVLSPELLRIVPQGWLGIHASLLPKYRGGAPLVWAILNGESSTGVSLFHFDEGMDTGDVVAQKQIDIHMEDTISEVLARAEVATLEIVQESYPLLLAGNAPRLRQDHQQATYAALRKPDDGRIEWRQPAARLSDFVRAQTHPYPGAFCRLGEHVVRVWAAKPYAFPFYGAPGQVVSVAADHAVVACGNSTALCVYVAQLDDGDEQNAAAILRFGQRLE